MGHIEGSRDVYERSRDACPSRFVLEQLSASEVYLWASTIEHRDDIEIEEASRDVLNELIFELATPEVNRPLTRELARDYIRRLSQSQHEPSGSHST